MLNHAMIASAEQTCYACPEQYEGKLADGSWFYFRFRSGYASLAVGSDYDAVMGRDNVGTEVGDGLQGIFDSPEQRDQVFADLLARVNRPSAPEVQP